MKVIALVTCLLLVPCRGMAQNTAVRWYTFSGGSGTLVSPSGNTTSIMGQVIVGLLEDNLSRVFSGFLADTLLRETILAVRGLPSLPMQFSLQQNYPNPFNPATTIQYTVPTRTHVTLTVFDLLGRKVANLVNDEQEPGQHAVVFDARGEGRGGFASGVYFYVMQAGGFVNARRMIVLR